MRYHGNHGIVGNIAFTLTGIVYKILGIFGITSKWIGKILFFVFLKGIPMLIKGIIKLIFRCF